MTRYIIDTNEMSYVDRCSNLNILPLSFRREISDLVFLFKCTNNLVDVNFNSEISINSCPNGRRSANGVLLNLNLVKTETFMASYFNRIVHMWNILPPNIRNTDSLISFKKCLIAHYTDKLYSFNVDHLCTWTSTCRCIGFYCR